MNKWVHQFLEKEPDRLTDNTDKPHDEGHLSVLSVPHQGHLDQNWKNIPPSRIDSTDKSHNGGLLSVLSVPAYGLPGTMPSYFPRGSELLDEYEERLAIAEYDGRQTPTQAERIAYLDSFLAVLATLAYEDVERDWLPQRIRSAQAWLLEQGIEQPK